MLQKSLNPPSLIYGVFLGLFPVAAHAQQIPTFMVLLALIPALNLLFSVLYGLINGNGRLLLKHLGLLLLWAAMFILFNKFTGSDLLAWLPTVLSLLHTGYLGFACWKSLAERRHS